MEKNNIKNLTFRDLLRPLFRQKLIIAFTFCIIIPIIYFGLKFQTPMYQARVLMQIKGVGQTAAPTYLGLGAWRIHLTQMSLVKSNPVLKRAVKALNLDKRPLDYEKKFATPLKSYIIDRAAEREKLHRASLSETEREKYILWKAMTDLKSNLITELEPNTDLFVIIAQDYDPQMAIQIANVVSRSYTIYDLQQQLAELTQRYGILHPTVQQIQDNINKTTANLTGRELPDIEAIGTASVKIVEQAATNYQAAGRPKIILMLAGVFVSGLIALALAFMFDMLNQTFKSPDDLVHYLDIAAIGSIPKKRLFDRQLIKDVSSSSTYVEFYNDLSDQIFIFSKVQNLQSLLLVAVSQQSANTAVAANLGYCLSQNSGIKTLVIDANINKPTIHNLLKLKESKGFVNLLEDSRMNIDACTHKIAQKLSIIQTGVVSDNITALLNETKIKQIVKKARSKYDSIIIDCTALSKLSDIAILSSSVDGVILMVNEGRDHIQVSRSVMHNLRLNKANIIGGILNNRTFPIPSWLYKKI
ncbi:MAG: AAA family ATPase [Smithella sp.]|nr:AAA family ATPase [Smithella sp.]